MLSGLYLFHHRFCRISLHLVSRGIFRSVSHVIVCPVFFFSIFSVALPQVVSFVCCMSLFDLRSVVDKSGEVYRPTSMCPAWPVVLCKKRFLETTSSAFLLALLGAVSEESETLPGLIGSPSFIMALFPRTVHYFSLLEI